MADNLDEVSASLDEIKRLLENKKKEKGDAITADAFTDPRFIELFDSYFKPLIESSKTISDQLTEKKKVSVFDVLGISDRIQDRKRAALISEYDKLTEKIRNISKNLGSVRSYTISDVLGLTKTERNVNRSIINHAIRRLSLSINKSAKNLGDPELIMKFIGLKPIKMPSTIDIKASKTSIKKTETPASITPTTPSAPSNDKTIEPPVVISDSIKTVKGKKTKTVKVNTTDTEQVSEPVQKIDNTKKLKTVKATQKADAPIVEKVTKKTKSVDLTKPSKSTNGNNSTVVDVSEPATNTNKRRKTRKVSDDVASTDDSKKSGQNSPQKTLSEKIDESKETYNVSIVGLSDELKKWLSENVGISGKNSRRSSTATRGGKTEDDTDTDRESYSRRGNALTRMFVLQGGLFLNSLSVGLITAVKGLTDQGPLKGLEKLVSINALRVSKSIFKSMVKFTTEYMPEFIGKFTKNMFSGLTKLAGSPSIVGNATKSLGGTLKAGKNIMGWMGKIAKKIPGIGLLLSLGYAIDRFANGDIQGGFIDIASGAASTIPGIGTAASIGLDIVNAQADLASGGVVGTSKKKGWLGKMNKFLGDMFAKIIYFQLNKLPFGLGEKVAGWLGLDMTGLAMTAAVGVDEDPDKATNPAVAGAKIKVDRAQKLRTNSEAAQKNILQGRTVDQLNEQEKAEYDRHSAIIQRTNKSDEEQKAILNNQVITKPPVETTNSTIEPKNPIGEQKPINDIREPESVEALLPAIPTDNKNQNAGEMRVDTPYVPPELPPSKDAEVLKTLTNINSSLELMNNKPSQVISERTPDQTMFNVSTIAGGGQPTTTMLQLAIETVRDTCYSIREKNRGLIINYRSLA